jgi:hypothetical protein
MTKIYNTFDVIIEFYKHIYTIESYYNSQITISKDKPNPLLNAQKIWDENPVQLYYHSGVIFKSNLATIDSIKILIEKERFSDAITLLRNYRDNIFFDIYIKVACYKDDKKKIEKINTYIKSSTEKSGYSNEWLKYIYLYNEDVAKPIKIMLDVLNTNMNNFVHKNGLQYFKTNYIPLKNNLINKGTINSYLYAIFVFQYTYTFLLNPKYLFCGDYLINGNFKKMVEYFMELLETGEGLVVGNSLNLENLGINIPNNYEKKLDEFLLGLLENIKINYSDIYNQFKEIINLEEKFKEDL